MSSLQPPPLPLLKMVGATIGLWFQDTWNKLKNLQTQSNTALYVSGMKLSNATPDGNDISWSACTVYYQGAAYSVAAGNTTGGATLVWWSVGDATFSSGNSYTPGPSVFAIATNNQGTADTTWNKVGAESIQESQVLGGFTSGYAPQNPSDVTIGGGATSTTLLSYTGAGGRVSIGITDTSGGSGSPGGNMTLAIVFDGGAAQTYTLRLSAFSPSGLWTTEFLNSAPGAVGSGSTSGDRGIIPFGTAFKTSCVITLNTPGGLQGGLACTVNWAKKLIV